MTFPAEIIHESLRLCGATWKALPYPDHQKVVSRWVSVYGEIYKSYWRKKSGPRAIADAEAATEKAFLLVPCRDPSQRGWDAVGEAYSCLADKLPDLTEASHFVDIFISPQNLSWTLLYGHETDVFGGPIFARVGWCVAPTPERQEKARYRKRN